MTTLDYAITAEEETTKDYQRFIENKAHLGNTHGFKSLWIPDFLFDFQKSLIDWAITKGRADILADCGLGKSIQELVWSENVVRHTNKSVLILTPCAVSAQTIREAEKFGCEARRSLDGKIRTGAHSVVTNYEKLHMFDPNDFVGVVCDECFPPDTPVDLFGTHSSLPIMDIQKGDAILNAQGEDHVKHLRDCLWQVRCRRRRPRAAIRRRGAGGRHGMTLKPKAILEAKLKELLRSASKEAIKIEAVADEVEAIQQLGDREIAILSLDRDAEVLRQVRLALQRIANKSYGICGECEEEISPKRLVAIPWAELCIKCQTEADSQRLRYDVLLDEDVA